MVVVGGFDANIAVLSEGHRQLVVHKLVDTQVLIVALAGIVRSVDIAEQVELINSGFFIATSTVAIDIAMLHRNAAI